MGNCDTSRRELYSDGKFKVDSGSHNLVPTIDCSVVFFMDIIP